MPVRLIPCRLKDDHSVTSELGETALPYFPQWEPIPGHEPEPPVLETEEERDERNRQAVARETAAENDPPSRSRTRKTSTDEGA